LLFSCVAVVLRIGAERRIYLDVLEEDKEFGEMGGDEKEGLNSDWSPNRSFLARAYPTMKKNNPHTPIMLREAAGTQPRVYARYGG